MRSADAKQVRRPVLQKLHYHHHVTAPQVQIVNGTRIVLNAGFPVWALQQIMQ